MNKKQVKHIVDVHYKKLKKQSREIARDFDMEAIHDFRVEYKKLRAFFRLISETQEVSEKIKIPGKLKRFYRFAGILRDLQLQQVSLREAVRTEIKKPAGYYYLLHKKVEKQKARVLKILHTNPVKNSQDKTGSLLPEICSLPTFQSYFDNKWQKIVSIIHAGHFADNDFHTIRKILKDLLYNSRIYQQEEQPSREIIRKKDEQYIDELLDALGRYQDKCTSISLIKPAWLQKMAPCNRQQPGRIREEWIKEKVAMKHVLTDNLKHAVRLFKK